MGFGAIRKMAAPLVARATNPYVSKLSPGAQQLKDSMAARRAARTAPAVQPAAPQMRMADPRPPRMMRDGGAVTKSFNRKPNGKPY